MEPAICFKPKPGNPIPIESAANETINKTAPTTNKTIPIVFLLPIVVSPWYGEKIFFDLLY